MGIIILLLMGKIMSVHAQEDIEKKFPTNKLRVKTEEDKKKHRPKERRLVYIYKTNTVNTLYGNLCALDVTRRWGFEYALEDNTTKNFKKTYHRTKNNFGVKIRLFFTKGPWWKLVINSRLKDCQVKTGDATG